MARDLDISSAIREERQPGEVGPAIAGLAKRQHGVIGGRQLAALGLNDQWIHRAVRLGRLHRLHRGVFAVGHELISRHGQWLAAVLACGPGSALSNQSAGANLEVIGYSPSVPHVTTPTTRRQRAGMRLHFANLPPDEVENHNGIPTTTLARTVLDLAATSDRHTVERALAEAEYRRLLDPVGIPALLERYPGRRGTRVLREILDARAPAVGVTKDWLEARFLRFLDRHDLPRPELNAPLEVKPGTWIKVDCLWRAQRLAVELDGRAAHIRAANFESDRARDRRLTVAGWRTIRVTKRHLEEDHAELARDLETLLGPTLNA